MKREKEDKKRRQNMNVEKRMEEKQSVKRN